MTGKWPNIKAANFCKKNEEMVNSKYNTISALRLGTVNDEYACNSRKPDDMPVTHSDIMQPDSIVADDGG